MKHTKNIPEVEILEDEDSLDVLVKSALENQNNRYKRNNPATYAEKVKANEPSKPSSPPKATATSSSNANSASTSEATATENNEVPTATKGNNSNET